MKTHSNFENSFKFLLSWWSRFKRISIRQNQAWQKRKQNTDKSIANKDTNKRRIIVNNKQGCTQTAYLCSLVTMLVLHGGWLKHHDFSKHLFFLQSNSVAANQPSGLCRAYLIIVTDAADAVSVNFFGRCKFLQI